MLSQQRHRHLSRAAGFLLLELMLTLVIVSTLGIMGMTAQVEELGDTRALAQGKAMLTVQAAQNTYITNYYDNLLNHTAIALPGGGNVADIYHPTIAELIALNVGLSSSFSNQALNGGKYHVDVNNVGGQLEALAWIDKPFVAPNGNPDLPRLGLAVRAIGPDGGFSTNTSPGTYRTLAMAVDEPNPAGSVAGTLVARSGYNTLSMQAFLRRDGSLPMTGNLQMGAQNISGAKNIDASGTLTANTVNGASGTIGSLTSTTIGTGSINAISGTISSLSANAIGTGGITNSGAYNGTGAINTAGDLNAANVATPGAVTAGSIKAGSINAGSLATSGSLTVTGSATMGSQTVNGDQVIAGNTTVIGALVPGLIAYGGGGCGGHPGAIARDASNNLYICN